METKKRRLGMLEAILFTMGEPVEVEKLAQAIECDYSEAKMLLAELQEMYVEQERGIRLVELEDAYQMCTWKEAYPSLIRIAKQPQKHVLTDVLLETLSIVAYRQPITKLEVEKIRGVKSDHAVNKLVEYGLLEEVGRLNAPGKPLLFGTTMEFLRRFGVQSIEELPTIDPQLVANLKEEVADEVQLRMEV